MGCTKRPSVHVGCVEPRTLSHVIMYVCVRVCVRASVQTGCRGGGVFDVNDPGFNQATYTIGDIVTNAVYH